MTVFSDVYAWVAVIGRGSSKNGLEKQKIKEFFLKRGCEICSEICEFNSWLERCSVVFWAGVLAPCSVV